MSDRRSSSVSNTTASSRLSSLSVVLEKEGRIKFKKEKVCHGLASQYAAMLQQHCAAVLSGSSLSSGLKQTLSASIAFNPFLQTTSHHAAKEGEINFLEFTTRLQSDNQMKPRGHFYLVAKPAGCPCKYNCKTTYSGK